MVKGCHRLRQGNPIGPCERESGERCSGKGFLPMAMPIEDYLELLDWTARLGLDAACWCELVNVVVKLSRVAGATKLRCRSHMGMARTAPVASQAKADRKESNWVLEHFWLVVDDEWV